MAGTPEFTASEVEEVRSVPDPACPPAPPTSLPTVSALAPVPLPPAPVPPLLPGPADTTPDRPMPVDWEIAQQLASDAYFPHALKRVTADRNPELTLSSTRLGPVRFARIGWGTDVRVVSDHPGGYAINIPLTGHLTSLVRGDEVIATPGQATVCPPDTETHITEWNRTCQVLGVGIDRAHLDLELSRMFDTATPLPNRIDLTTPRGRSWLNLVGRLAQTAADDDLLSSGAVADQLAGAVTTAFVLAAMPDTDAPPPPRPRIVKRVQDALCADPGRPWTLGDMAECAGVGVRRLQEGFRQYVGRTPSEYLLDIRLERAHADLLSGDPGRTVTDIARTWGFAHTGRFAASYRSRYGRTPSESLRG